MCLDKNFEEILQKEFEFSDSQKLNEKIENNKFLILYVNVRSMNENFEKLQVFLDSFKNKPNVIVCSETWIIHHIEFFKLPEYNIYYNYSKINKADGVVMYVKKDIIQETKTIKIDKLTFLVSDININDNEIFRISAIYRSHDIHKTEFVLSVKKYLQQSINVKNHCVIGDFNIDILLKNVQANENNIGQEFLNNFLEKEFFPCFLGVTRPATKGQGGTCIDNFFLKTNTMTAKSLKLINPFNDHYPLLVNLDKIKLMQRENKINKTLNYRKLVSIASKIEWNKILSIQEPNCAANEFISMIQQCTEKSTSAIKQRKNSRDSPRKKWITTAIIVSCKRKEMLYNMWKNNQENTTLKKEYVDYNKILARVIKDAKFKYERDKIKNHSNDPKKLWKIINDKIGKSKKNENTISYIYENGKKIEDKKNIAAAMNNYFCEVGNNLSNKIKTLNVQQKQVDRNPKSIFIKPTNSQEVSKIINELKEKAGGEDEINTKTLKEINKYITLPLVHIFNLSIEKAVWPEALKSAEVIPIFKAGDKSSIPNYRPISLISNIAKIFEKIIYDRLYCFLVECKILSKYQFGFMKGKSTTNALNKIVDIIYKNLDKSRPIIAVFLDLAKAFDTVNHELLLEKLERYGIRGNVFELIKSYLTDRKQKVRIKDKRSSEKILNTGVPQGTILGPLFFVLYVNDLLLDMQQESILSYADDTVIISDDDTWSAAQDKMNKLVEKVANWLALNKLSLNTNKTVFMTFGNYCDSVPSEINIEIHGQKIQRVESQKYLGIIFDYNMKWNKHIEYIIHKTKYLIFIFAKIKKIMDIQTLMMIYYAIFHSIISYGITAWGGAYKNNLDLIQKIQTKILKIINKNLFPGKNYPPNIYQMFKIESVTYYYKELKEKYLQSTSKTRNKNLLLPNMRKTVSDKNSYIVALKTFNVLPNELKCMNLSKSNIKNKIKNFIMYG